MYVVIIQVVMSEAGKLNQTPVNPQYFGSIIKNGIKNKNCLVNDKNIEVLAKPILWNNAVATIWKPNIGKKADDTLNP